VKGKPQKPRRKARPDEIASGGGNGELDEEMKHKNKYRQELREYDTLQRERRAGRGGGKG